MISLQLNVEGHRPRKRRISIVGLVDIVFILLIFFALESNFLQLRELAFEPVEAATNTSPPNTHTPISIELMANGVIWIGTERLSFAEFSAFLLQRSYGPDERFLLLAESQVLLQNLVQIIDQLSANGLENVQIQELKP